MLQSRVSVAPSKTEEVQRLWLAALYTRAAAVIWIVAIYLPLTAVLASRKQLWNDELFTYYIARQPGVRQIWDVLLTAVDQNPPPFYYVSQLCMRFGDGPFWIRLPEIIGFGLMSICLVLFVSHRLPPVYGTLAALIALLSGAYPYSQEARPYGLVLGFGALALLCWQRSSASRPLIWLAGFAISLALAVSSHYYAILLLLPFGAAETAVWWTDRKVRWNVVAALCAGFLPLLIFIPLIQRARSYSGTFWAKATIHSVEEYFVWLLATALLPLTVVAVWAILRRRFVRPEAESEKPQFLSLPETVAVCGFISIPFVAVALALTVTGAFTFRYAILGVIGVSACGAWLLALLFGTRTKPALAAAIFLSLFFCVRHVRSLRYIGKSTDHSAVIQWIKDRSPAGFQIAITDPHLFFEIIHARDEALTARLFYVADSKRALAHVGTDAVDRGLSDMRTVAHLPVRALDDVLTARQPFFVYGDPSTYGWLTQELTTSHLPVTVVDRFEDRWLLLITPETK